MKKLVPDPPLIPTTSPAATCDEALHRALAYIDKAIVAIDQLPDHVVLEKQPDLGDPLIDLKCSRAYLLVAQMKSAERASA